MVTVNRARCRKGTRPARRSYGQAVLLGIAATAVLACGYANAQVIRHRQLMPSQQQPDLFKRQSNETDGGVGISLSNTALVPGGSSTTTLMKTKLRYKGESPHPPACLIFMVT